MLGSGSCAACTAAGCKTCTPDVGTCTAALEGYYMNSGTPTACTGVLANCGVCTSSACTACADGYYLDTTCKACSTGCAKCSGASTCTACNTGYFLDKDQCVSCSAEGEYKADCTGKWTKQYWSC